MFKNNPNVSKESNSNLASANRGFSGSSAMTSSTNLNMTESGINLNEKNSNMTNNMSKMAQTNSVIKKKIIRVNDLLVASSSLFFVLDISVFFMFDFYY
jgi:hypothetical protein